MNQKSCQKRGPVTSPMGGTHNRPCQKPGYSRTRRNARGGEQLKNGPGWGDHPENGVFSTTAPYPRKNKNRKRANRTLSKSVGPSRAQNDRNKRTHQKRFGRGPDPSPGEAGSKGRTGKGGAKGSEKKFRFSPETTKIRGDVPEKKEPSLGGQLGKSKGPTPKCTGDEESPTKKTCGEEEKRKEVR